MKLIEIIDNEHSGFRAIISQNSTRSHQNALALQYKVEFYDFLTESVIPDVFWFLDFEYGRKYYAVRMIDIEACGFFFRHRQPAVLAMH